MNSYKVSAYTLMRIIKKYLQIFSRERREKSMSFQFIWINMRSIKDQFKMRFI